MTIYEFAPARMSDRTQTVLRTVITVITVAVLAAGLVVSWPSHYAYWVQVLLITASVALASTFAYRVSSIDRFFTFGLTASIMAVLGPYENPVFIITAWSIGVFAGFAIQFRSVVIASQATLCRWFAATALVAAWSATDAWLASSLEPGGGIFGLLLSAHIPQMVFGLAAFYLTRVCIATGRSLVLTQLKLTEIVLRVSWVRIGIMFVSECLLASLVNAVSMSLNTHIFQTNTPNGKTSLIVIVSTTIFGLAAKRQAKTALQRVNSLVHATVKLPWPDNSPVHVQAEEFAQRALPEYQVTACDEERPFLHDHIRSIPIENDGASHTLVAVRKMGQPPFRIEDQRVLSAVAQVANETIRGRKEVHRLRRLANTDRLTGLLNYRAFQLALDELNEWHDPENLVALIFIDIDNFKTINDTYGHEVGNTVLKVVAERLQGAISQPSMVSRVGGDEFVILLQHLSSRTEAEAVQQRLREQVSVPIKLDGTVISLRISQGVAYSSPGQKDLSPLVELADRRMYESRGNRIEVTTGGKHDGPKLENEPSIVAALRDGVLERRLKLVYQPIADIETHRVVAVEALLRYTDPEHGVIPVALVLSEAERLGLLPELSEQVLELAVETYGRIRDRFPELRRVHVNIGLAQLLDVQFTQLVDELTAEYPEFELILEVNECSLRDATPKIIEDVEHFARNSRASLAIDDIGRTYTGLASLRDFPFAIWKVDLSVTQHFRHPRSAALVRGLIHMARDLQVDLIFEGIETDAQHEWLRGLGAQFGQGFLYGRPISAEELLLRLESAGTAARV